LQKREGDNRELIMIREQSWSTHAMVWDWTHDSRVMRVTGQLNDGSRGSRVTKCDPFVTHCQLRAAIVRILQDD